MRNARTHQRLRVLRIGLVAFTLVAASLLGGTSAAAQTPCTSPPEVIPEDQMTPGTTGIGSTTLSGSSPTAFSFRVVGVITNGWMLGLDAIAIQITGPSSFLDQTSGVFFGMSGSPAYVNGKLAGAVSGVFYDDATFAVLTPADAMLDLLEYVGASPTPARRVPLTDQVRRAIAKADGVSAGD